MSETDKLKEQKKRQMARVISMQPVCIMPSKTS